MAWADKADYLIALFGAGAVGALLDRIADAVRLSDDIEVGRLDRLLQHVEKRLQQPWQITAGVTPLHLSKWTSEPVRHLAVA